MNVPRVSLLSYSHSLQKYFLKSSPVNYVSALNVHQFKNCAWFNSEDVVSSFQMFFTTRPSSKGPPWKLLFVGTDEFALRSLQPLNAKLNTGTLISDLAVVALRDSTVRKFSEAENLPTLDWPIKLEDIKGRFDLGIVVSFGHLISKEIIEAIPLGILNVHGSILPRWRGAAPIVYSIMNGDPETGVTVMKIDPYKFDTGAVVRQYRCPIGPHETTPELTSRLAEQGGRLIMECIRDLPRCVEMATPQPSEGITYAPRVKMELSMVDWSKMSAKQVYNLHRAISHLHLLSTIWHGTQARLLDITIDPAEPDKIEEISSEISSKSAVDFLNSTSEPISVISRVTVSSKVNPGTIFYSKKTKTMKIQCADGLCVTCGGLRIGGKNFISPHEFYNGYLSKKNKTDWYFS